MNLPRPFFLLPWVAVVVLSSSACISVPDIEPAKAAVRIASPEATAYTNGVLEVRLTVTGHAPERVELLKDGEVLATLEAPYTYAWDTAREAEGTHRLEARAVLGEETFHSEARDVVVDRTPPQVVSRTPEPGAQDVWVKSPIQAVFSEPVKVTEASVRLTVGGVDVARTVKVSADGRTVTVEPLATIEPPSTVAVVLPKAVTDMAGNPLTMASTWSWSHPISRLVPYGPNLPEASGRSVLAISALLPDGTGDVIVARTEQDSTGRHLRVYKQVDSEWFPMGDSLEFRGANFEPEHVTLKLDPIHDTPVIAWHEGMGSNDTERIYVARWTGSGWDYLGGAEGVTPTNPYSTFPVLALNDTGSVFVALQDDSELNTYIYHWSGGIWSILGSDVGSALGLTQARPFSLQTSTTGNPIVAVQGLKGNVRGFHVAEWTGSEWRPFGGVTESSSPPVNFANHASPHFMLDPQGRPTLSWFSRSTDQSSQAFTYTWDGNDWKPRCAQFVASAVGYARGTFQMDKTGTAWLGWSESDTPTFRFAQCNNGTWTYFASSAAMGTQFAAATLDAFTTTHSTPFFAAVSLPDGSSRIIRASVNP